MPGQGPDARSGAAPLVAALPGVSDGAIVDDGAGAPAPRAPTSPSSRFPACKNIIAVGAGKGGVGKTTVSVNLAIALSQAGARVAMIDGDIYGPNVPIMLGISTQLGTDGRRSCRPSSTAFSSCRWRS